MTSEDIKKLIDRILNHIPVEDAYANDYVLLSNVVLYLKIVAGGTYDRKWDEEELSEGELAAARWLARENVLSLAFRLKDLGYGLMMPQQGTPAAFKRLGFPRKGWYIRRSFNPPQV